MKSLTTINLSPTPRWAQGVINHKKDCALALSQLQTKTAGGIKATRARCPTCGAAKLLDVEVL